MVATDKRIIILNREVAGLRKDIESIPYDRIASVRMEKGLLTSSVYLRVGGFSGGDEQGFIKKGEDEGEIAGLKKGDAKALSDYVNQMISGFSSSGVSAGNFQQGAKQQAPPSSPGATMFCPKCGAANALSAKFCTACGAKLGK